MNCIADDIVCDAPGAHLEGGEAFRAFEGGFFPMITGGTLLAAFGEEETALLMYDIATIPVPGNITAARATVKDGKITTLRIVYDATPFAALQGGPQAQ